MKLSFNWLSDYVDLEGISIEEVKEKLTMGAFEVEEVTKVGPSLSGSVKVGRILEINPHPNADKIRMTKTIVEEGASPLDIVCGATNIEVGQLIPVALPGAVVVDRKSGKQLEIKVSEIRGVTSNGMLCSPPELGITDGDSEGILILDPDKYQVGEDIIEKLALKPDWILHVEPRSNRGDALCVIGLAREVAALFNKKLKDNLDIYLEDAKEKIKPDFKVKIENEAECKYFTARLLDNISVGESPAWMVRRLEALGMRSVNNIVDITNYVMLETGQPLHAYDLSKLNNGLFVRRAHRDSSETLVLIDGKERTLANEVLTIADQDTIVGVAGVMGGKGSEISDDTTTIALEAAAFDSKRVRRASRLLGLSSDSSHRFERGVDVTNVELASNRATFLIQKYAKPKTSAVKVGELLKAGSRDYQPAKIQLRLSKIKKLLAIDLSLETCKGYLESLGFACKASAESTLDVEVPSFRATDVTREIDLIEEICRLYGYDNIADAMPSKTVAPPTYCRLDYEVKTILASKGLSEAWLSSLRPEDDLVQTSVKNNEYVRVLNPLSKDHQVLRQSLVPGLLESLKYNLDHGNKDSWLFEIGRGYHLHTATNGENKSDTGAKEKKLVASVITGSLVKQINVGFAKEDKKVNLSQIKETVDYFRMKGVLESLIEALNIDTDSLYFDREEALPPCLHPYRSGHVKIAQTNSSKHKSAKAKTKPELTNLGWLGELHPRDAHRIGFKQPVYIFELNLDLIKEARSQKSFIEPAQTPSILRDLTADLDSKVAQSDVMRLIKNAGGKKLENVELVSIFDLSETERSLSYRLTFQDKEETLTNDEVEKRLNKVRQTLSHQLSAQFRA